MKSRAKLIFKIFIGVIFFSGISQAQTQKVDSRFTIARLKYSGGGDWYNDPSAIPNLQNFIQSQANIVCAADEVKVEVTDQELFSYPVLFMTGHGKITITNNEASRLNEYLTHGGFLYADDDYGMDKYFRAMMKKVFPTKKIVEIPFDHPIYKSHFIFNNGLPKIHEHDGGPPRGYGIFHEGRLVVFYSFNTNISDGWADPEVHNDPESVRIEALKMGTNIIVYSLTN